VCQAARAALDQHVGRDQPYAQAASRTVHERHAGSRVWTGEQDEGAVRRGPRSPEQRRLVAARSSMTRTGWTGLETAGAFMISKRCMRRPPPRPRPHSPPARRSMRSLRRGAASRSAGAPGRHATWCRGLGHQQRRAGPNGGIDAVPPPGRRACDGGSGQMVWRGARRRPARSGRREREDPPVGWLG
jgi:hypothetical protein